MDGPLSKPVVKSGSEEKEGTGTRMESAEEIRVASQPRRTPTAKEKMEENDTVDFRPLRRPPMATLCLLDDGRQEGETVRLRGDLTVIGRSEGDIIIAHDTEMSGRHLSITREAEADRFRWFLNDLGSRNGSFARVSKTILRQGQEVLLGGKRYRFHAANNAATIVAPASESTMTRAFKSVQVDELIPSLEEVTPEGDGRRLLLKQQENWVGRDAKLCTVLLVDDMLASPRHAKIFRDAKGVWYVENAGSRNGVWLRFNKLPVESFSEFQVGEQRCMLRIVV